ncbi:MAG: hypothetical protein KBE04_12700 [Phycisphaerae bacterium]|nr:hypothetical protein [Phycisphaerae bacterium]
MGRPRTNYVVITADTFPGDLRGAGAYVLADWTWVLSHMDRDGYVVVSP